MPKKSNRLNEEQAEDVSRGRVAIWLISGLFLIVVAIIAIGEGFDLMKNYINRDEIAQRRAAEESYAASLRKAEPSTASNSQTQNQTFIRTEADIDAFLANRYYGDKRVEMKKAACAVYGVCR